MGTGAGRLGKLVTDAHRGPQEQGRPEWLQFLQWDKRRAKMDPLAHLAPFFLSYYTRGQPCSSQEVSLGLCFFGVPPSSPLGPGGQLRPPSTRSSHPLSGTLNSSHCSQEKVPSWLGLASLHWSLCLPLFLPARPGQPARTHHLSFPPNLQALSSLQDRGVLLREEDFLAKILYLAQLSLKV